MMSLQLSSSDLPQIASRSYTPCDHPYLIGQGYSENGKHRLKCKYCGMKFTEGAEKESRKLAVTRLLASVPGIRNWQVKVQFRVDNATLTSLRRLLAKHGKLPNCPCGRPGGHKGKCSYRPWRVVWGLQ